MLWKGFNFAPSNPHNFFKLLIDLNRFIYNLTIKRYYVPKGLSIGMQFILSPVTHFQMTAGPLSADVTQSGSTQMPGLAACSASWHAAERLSKPLPFHKQPGISVNVGGAEQRAGD